LFVKQCGINKMVLAITSADHFKAQLEAAGGKLVVVDFHAVWCGPCKAIAPKIEELEKSRTDVVFLKVDVDDCEDVAMAHKVSCMPTFLFFKQAAKVAEFSGANYDKIVSTIQQHA